MELSSWGHCRSGIKSAGRGGKGRGARGLRVPGQAALGGSASGSCLTPGFVPITEGSVLAPAPMGDRRGCSQLLSWAQTPLPWPIPARPPLGGSRAIAAPHGLRWPQPGAVLPSENSHSQGFPGPDVRISPLPLCCTLTFAVLEQAHSLTLLRFCWSWPGAPSHQHCLGSHPRLSHLLVTLCGFLQPPTMCPLLLGVPKALLAPSDRH